MAFGNPGAERKERRHFVKEQEALATAEKPARKCDVCGKASVARVPAGQVEWVCQAHAEAFWRGLVLTAAGLREQDRAIAAAIEEEFYDQDNIAHALREANLVAHCYEMKNVRWTPCP